MAMNDLIKRYIGGIQKFQLQLTTLSPVAIRNGETLSPLTDYHIQDTNFYFVDSDKLLEEIAENGWLAEFEERVAEYTGNHSEGTETGAREKKQFIQKFLKDKEVAINPYLKKETPLLCNIKSEEKWVQLHTTLKGLHGAYIPASTTKGAIRTAVLYQWLMTCDEGKKELESLISTYKDWIQKRVEKKNNINKQRKTAKENNEIEKEKEFKGQLKEQEKDNKQEILNRLNAYEKKIGEVVFGNEEGGFSIATFLKVSDSITFSYGDLQVGSLAKKYREDEETKEKRGKEFTPALQEFIGVNKKSGIDFSLSNLSLDLQSPRRKGYLSGILTAKNGLAELFKALKLFSKDYLAFEIARLKGFQEGEKTGRYYIEEELAGFHQTLEGLNKICLGLKPNEAMLCLGFGKSVFMNTVLLAISKTDREVFTNIIKMLYPNHPKQKFFPISYYTTSIGQQDYPFGWVKIEDGNVDNYKEESSQSYSENELRSGEPIEAIVKKQGKPRSTVAINIDGVERLFEVCGTKDFLRNNNTLHVDTKCIVYWRNDQLNFNK